MMTPRKCTNGQCHKYGLRVIETTCLRCGRWTEVVAGVTPDDLSANNATTELEIERASAHDSLVAHQEALDRIDDTIRAVESIFEMMAAIERRVCTLVQTGDVLHRHDLIESIGARLAEVMDDNS